jgi:hypothetical protein
VKLGPSTWLCNANRLSVSEREVLGRTYAPQRQELRFEILTHYNNKINYNDG